jgi:hypothetical protein
MKTTRSWIAVAAVFLALGAAATPAEELTYQKPVSFGEAGMPYNFGPAALAAWQQPVPMPQPTGEGECDECEMCLPECRRGCCWEVFGDYLLLRVRDAEVAYAVPIDGAIVPPPAVPVQVGPTAVVDAQYDSGFRVGAGYQWDDCATLRASFSWFESGDDNEIATAAPNVLRSVVTHPGAQAAPTDFLRAQASHDIEFQLGDVDYSAIFSCSELHVLSWVIGARYAHLEQNFRSRFADGGVEAVATDITFDGGGIRLGLEGERYARGGSGLMVYGRGLASFVAGDFQGRYMMGTGADPTIVDTTWEAGRIVTILDLEAGVGWTSPRGRVRLMVGYMLSAWLNAVQTDEFIQGVRANNMVDLGDGLTFDGLVARAAIRF